MNTSDPRCHLTENCMPGKEHQLCSECGGFSAKSWKCSQPEVRISSLFWRGVECLIILAPLLARSSTRLTNLKANFWWNRAHFGQELLNQGWECPYFCFKTFPLSPAASFVYCAPSAGYYDRVSSEKCVCLLENFISVFFLKY